ncbi:hypothetical protein HBB16_01375 [Pseudonocardia sp. MCCB 268]|nr:hypothetical protein [Pseudonocardia cytotoxica]
MFDVEVTATDSGPRARPGPAMIDWRRATVLSATEFDVARDLLDLDRTWLSWSCSARAPLMPNGADRKFGLMGARGLFAHGVLAVLADLVHGQSPRSPAGPGRRAPHRQRALVGQRAGAGGARHPGSATTSRWSASARTGPRRYRSCSGDVVPADRGADPRPPCCGRSRGRAGDDADRFVLELPALARLHLGIEADLARRMGWLTAGPARRRPQGHLSVPGTGALPCTRPRRAGQPTSADSSRTRRRPAAGRRDRARRTGRRRRPDRELDRLADSARLRRS